MYLPVAHRWCSQWYRSSLNRLSCRKKGHRCFWIVCYCSQKWQREWEQWMREQIWRRDWWMRRPTWTSREITQTSFSRPSSIKEGIVHAALAQTEPAREKVEVTTAGKRKSRCHAALSAERSRTSVCVCVCECSTERRVSVCSGRDPISVPKSDDSLEQPQSYAS